MPLPLLLKGRKMADIILMSDLDKIKADRKNKQQVNIKKTEKKKAKTVKSIKNNIPFYNVLPDNSWKNKRCFIVGGGVSLKDFDFSILKNEKTIGLNGSLQGFSPDILFFIDSSVAFNYENKKYGKLAYERWIDQSKTLKVCVQHGHVPYPEDIYNLKIDYTQDFTLSMKNGLGSCDNSGYAAINLAYCLGVKEIYLLGFDLNTTGYLHWWDKSKMNPNKAKIYKRFNTGFEKLAKRFENTSTKIINLNGESNIKCFKFDDIKNIIKTKKYEV